MGNISCTITWKSCENDDQIIENLKKNCEKYGLNYDHNKMIDIVEFTADSNGVSLFKRYYAAEAKLKALVFDAQNNFKTVEFRHQILYLPL